MGNAEQVSFSCVGSCCHAVILFCDLLCHLPWLEAIFHRCVIFQCVETHLFCHLSNGHFLNSVLNSRDEEKFRDHGNYDPTLLTKLVRNYRSHPDILSLPSRLFYDDELVPCASMAVQNRFCLSPLLPTKNHPVVFHGVRGQNVQEGDSPSWFNPQEAWQTTVYIRALITSGVDPADVGIIAPYRKQVTN